MKYIWIIMLAVAWIIWSMSALIDLKDCITDYFKLEDKRSLSDLPYVIFNDTEIFVPWMIFNMSFLFVSSFITWLSSIINE